MRDKIDEKKKKDNLWNLPLLPPAALSVPLPHSDPRLTDQKKEKTNKQTVKLWAVRLTGGRKEEGNLCKDRNREAMEGVKKRKKNRRYTCLFTWLCGVSRHVFAKDLQGFTYLWEKRKTVSGTGIRDLGWGREGNWGHMGRVEARTWPSLEGRLDYMDSSHVRVALPVYPDLTSSSFAPSPFPAPHPSSSPLPTSSCKSRS